MPLAVDLLDARAQLDGTERHLEVLERPSQVARCQPEERPRLEIGQRELSVAVDDELRDRDRLEAGVADERIGREPDERVFRGRQLHARRSFARRFCEDSALQVDRHEEVAARRERFRLPEEEEPALSQGEVEARQDAPLRFRVEVHERVAREQQRDPRDRRILDQVVAAEDDRPT